MLKDTAKEEALDALSDLPIKKESIELRILKLARARIAKRGHWCRNTLAMNKDGETVTVSDADAVRWCAVGSLYWASALVLGDSVGSDIKARKIASQMTPSGIALEKINDKSRHNPGWGHKGILALFDNAIITRSS